jgi:hypothetical protein
MKCPYCGSYLNIIYTATSFRYIDTCCCRMYNYIIYMNRSNTNSSV